MPLTPQMPLQTAVSLPVPPLYLLPMRPFVNMNAKHYHPLAASNCHLGKPCSAGAFRRLKYFVVGRPKVHAREPFRAFRPPHLLLPYHRTFETTEYVNFGLGKQGNGQRREGRQVQPAILLPAVRLPSCVFNFFFFPAYPAMRLHPQEGPR
jgi:hypothetical protein